jgi:hypothetical protein
MPSMRRSTWPMAALLLTSALAACGGGSTAEPVEPKAVVAVVGDVPYGTGPTDDAQLKVHPAFIAALNADADVSVVLHVGDIHSGKEYCTEAYDRTIAAQWSTFKFPVVYTPGDNEWADCHKVKQGGGSYTAGAISLLKDAAGNLLSYVGGDPIANLQLVRSIFFPTPGKTAGVAVDVHTQAKEFDAAYPADAAYVENVWWMKSKVLFLTLNVPGGSNNDNDVWYGAPTASAAQAQEIATRSAANKRWLDAAFKAAAANGAIGVVIQLQADMWDLDGVFTANAAGQNHIHEYKQFIDKIATNAAGFGKPVLLFNGDSHVFRTDNPLKPGSACAIEPSSGAAAVACSAATVPVAFGNGKVDAYENQPHGYSVPNFRRITVHGSTTPLEYLKLTIDPAANAENGTEAFGPFSWKRVKPL